MLIINYLFSHTTLIMVPLFHSLSSEPEEKPPNLSGDRFPSSMFCPQVVSVLKKKILLLFEDKLPPAIPTTLD